MLQHANYNYEMVSPPYVYHQRAHVGIHNRNTQQCINFILRHSGILVTKTLSYFPTCGAFC